MLAKACAVIVSVGAVGVLSFVAAGTAAAAVHDYECINGGGHIEERLVDIDHHVRVCVGGQFDGQQVTYDS